jgi:tyrosyl-tRNA synthetase
MTKVDKEKIEELLNRGVEDIIVREVLEKKLLSGKKLRIYFGVDPTGSLLHLGHAVVLRKMREFQELGHEVILLIGDFTAKIGDPSGRDLARQPLTDKKIKENMRGYKKQASKVLDFSKIKVKYNSKWLSKLDFSDILELSSHFTVQQILHRDMFDKRIKENVPISHSEFMYPLMQGYDSVAMNVDLEIGGNDQMFNMLAGRTLQKNYNNKDKNIMTVKLLLGTDGQKMSKTYNNAIYLNDSPIDMFGKLMSVKDGLISHYFELCTMLSKEDIEKIKKLPNPRDQKIVLAKEIVKMYHGEKSAQKVEEKFKRGEYSDVILKKIGAPEIDILDLMTETGLASSKSEAKRLIMQKGVKINGEVQTDWQKIIPTTSGTKIQVGKRKFLELI